MLHVVKWHHDYFLVCNDNGIIAVLPGNSIYQAFYNYFEHTWNTSEQPSRAIHIANGYLYDEGRKHPVVSSIDDTDISSAEQLFDRYPELLV